MAQFTQLSDGELIEACRARKPRAWDALVERYERLVYSIPLRYGLPKSEADDVFQSVWLALLRHLDSLKEPDRISAWLAVTTRRECWERRRGMSFERERTVDPLELPERGKQLDDVWPEQIVEKFEQHQTMQSALQQLEKRCRRLIWHLYQDPSRPGYTEVAQKLGMKAGAIGPTRARCLKKLKEFFAV